MGVPRMMVVYFADDVEEAQHRVSAAGALLIVCHAHQCHHAAQHDAQCQRNGSDQQGGAHAVDVLRPAVFQDEGLIKFEEELLLEAELGAAVEQLFEQFVLSSHSHPHFPVLLEFCNLIFPKKGRCPSWGLPPRGSVISQLIIQR